MTVATNGPPVLNGAAFIYPSVTLSALRTRLLTLLGFADPQTGIDGEIKDLAFFRESILELLGFADPLANIETQTLVYLRETLIRRLGQYYIAGSNAPGVDDLIDSFINEAQQTLFRTLELDQGATTAPALMTLDADTTELDYVPVLALALGLAKAHYGQPDAKAYFDQMTKYLQDYAARRPPNITDMIDSWVNAAQQFIFRALELDKGATAFPAEMVESTDECEIDYVPILHHAVALAKAHFKQPDSQLYVKQVEKYLIDRATRRPPHVASMCTQWLQQAQTQLYTRYSILRTERWWSIPIVQGERIYDVPSISSGVLTVVAFVSGTPATITRSTGSWLTDGFRAGYRIKATGSSVSGNNNVQWTIASVTASTITLATGNTVTSDPAGDSVTITTANYMSLDFRTVSEAWLQDSETWLPLRGGIPASMFNITQQTIPSHYEMREYFEVFPAPDKAYTAWIKGHFGLLPFDADTDVTTIDADAILLQALAWGKAHFRHPDAILIQAEMEKLVGQLNAGAFAGMRYIPNPRPQPVAVPYPQVTFVRP